MRARAENCLWLDRGGAERGEEDDDAADAADLAVEGEGESVTSWPAD